MSYDAGTARARYELGLTQFESSIQRAKQLYAELLAAQQQATRPASLPGPSAPGGGPSAPRAASFAQEARAVAALEAQQARLARAQGDAARAAQLEAQAQQTLTAALVRTDTTTQQAIGLQRQLATVQAQAARAGQQAAGGASQLGDAMAGIAGPAVLAGAALGAIMKGADLVQLGAQADQTRQRFEGLSHAAGTTGDAILAALRSASGRTISDLNLQLAANRAQLLGVADSAGEFATLMQIARARAQDMGISTTQAFNDLVTGLGRGSALILDNLGITVSVTEANRVYAEQLGITASALTEAQKKQALINAVLAQGKASLEAAGGATETNAAKIERLGAAWDNFKASAGGALADITLPTIDAITSLSQVTDGSRESLLRYVDAANTYTHANAQVAQINRDAAGALADLLGLQSQEALLAQQQAQATNVLSQEQQLAAQNTALLAGQQAHLRDEHLQVGQIVQQTSAQVQEFNARLAENAAQAQVSAAQASILRARQEEIAQASVLAARGMLGSGDQALLMAKKYGIARDQAELLINEQRRLDAAQALKDQRAGERSGGAVRTEAELRAQNKARQLNADFERTQEEKRRQQAAAQQALDLARARTPSQRIAILQRELNQTTDITERLRIQTQIENERRSGMQAHTSELGKQLTLEEKIRDSKESQLKASIDARKLAAQDTLDRLKEDQQLAQARRVLASSGDARFRAAAQARIDLIGAERDSRALAIREAQGAAGGAVGPLPGAAPGAPIPPLPAPGAPAAPGAAGPQQAAGGGITVQLVVDGQKIAEVIVPSVVQALSAGHTQNRAAGGR